MKMKKLIYVISVGLHEKMPPFSASRPQRGSRPSLGKEHEENQGVFQNMRFPSEAFKEIAQLCRKGKSKKTARLFS